MSIDARTLPRESERTAAQMAIMQLHARYVDAVWRKDHEAIGDCLTEDCEWKIAGNTIMGRAAAVAYERRMSDQAKKIFVTLRTPVLDIGIGIAAGRTYFSARNFRVDGRLQTVLGIYYERFVKEPDGWRINWRVFETLQFDMGDGTSKLMDVPDFGPPPTMPPPDYTPPAPSLELK